MRFNYKNAFSTLLNHIKDLNFFIIFIIFEQVDQ